MNEVRVRFAPSPTGNLHIGGAHTALFNWLWARHMGGKFVLRIEDSDRERSTLEYEESIYSGLEWLGLLWNEGPRAGGPYGPYRQSERLEIYREYAGKLVDKGLAYREGEAIIFRVVPGEIVSFDDIVYGHIEVKSETLKDIVMIKSDGMPTYNYAVVIDDYTMSITHVIRGEDHIANTPKQILLYKALGFELPQFAHLPMILGKDKKKLSKRHGATNVLEYKDMGFLPEALFNFLALLGWSPGDDREIFTIEEAVELFDIKDVNKRAAVFDMDKLRHINQEHIKRMNSDKRLEAVKPFWEDLGLPYHNHSSDYLAKVLDIMEGRGQTLKELAEYTDYFLTFEPVKERVDREYAATSKEVLGPFCEDMIKLSQWETKALEDFAREWSNKREVPLKKIAMPLRVLLTGTKVSPGIFEVIELLGKDETIKRLSHWGILNVSE